MEAFDYCGGDNLTISCYQGSYAETCFKNDTVVKLKIIS
jgi:hypothetical protein